MPAVAGGAPPRAPPAGSGFLWGGGGGPRFRLLLHGERRAGMQDFVRALLAKAPRPRGSVRVQVDIDPQSFL